MVSNNLYEPFSGSAEMYSKRRSNCSESLAIHRLNINFLFGKLLENHIFLGNSFMFNMHIQHEVGRLSWIRVSLEGPEKHKTAEFHLGFPTPTMPKQHKHGPNRSQGLRSFHLDEVITKPDIHIGHFIVKTLKHLDYLIGRFDMTHICRSLF